MLGIPPLSGYHKFLVGLLLLSVIGTWGIFLNSFPGVLGDNDGFIYDTQDTLQTKVDAALEAENITWAQVIMNGQEAVVTGTAPSAEDLDKLKQTVQRAEWVGGIIRGGVTVVDTSKVNVQPANAEPMQIAAPFTWSASKAKGKPVIITGFVPNEEFRAELIDRALLFFPDGVVDEMRVARGEPSVNWKNAALINLVALSELEAGRVTAIDERFDLSGTTTAPSAASAARERVTLGRPQGFTGTIDVELLEPAAAGSEAGSAPDTGSLSLGAPAPLEAPMSLGAQSSEEVFSLDDAPNSDPELLNAADEPYANPADTNDTMSAARSLPEALASSSEAAVQCQDEFDEIMRGNTITFASGSAQIASESMPLLRSITSIAGKCRNFNIEVSGHTDNTGSDAFNQQLSQLRADAVGTFLRENGIPPEQVSTQGFGSSQPRAINTTAAGRRANRRIEFTILRNSVEE